MCGRPILKVPQIFFIMESPERPAPGSSSHRMHGGISRLAEKAIDDLCAAVGRIEPWRDQTSWAELLGPLGDRLGRVSVHTTPNSHTSLVRLILHGFRPPFARILQNIALQDAGGRQHTGNWLGYTQVFECQVPRDRSVTIQEYASKPPPAFEAQQVTQALAWDQWEQIQECLEAEGRRKGKRRK